MLMQPSDNSSLILSGSYIVVTCMNGYINTGGSYNITCSGNGSWSSFPNCVLNTTGGSMTTAATPIGNNSVCNLRSKNTI